MRYWIDWKGTLWKGPSCPDDNLHYATFDGYMIVEPFNPIWTVCRSEPPEDADEITEEQANRAASLFWPTTAFPRLENK